MTLYRLEGSSDRKNVGSYPQVRLIGGERAFPHFEVYDKSPNLQFETEAGAKLTDLIKVSSPGLSFLVSKKAKIILEGLRLPKHQWFPCIMHHRKPVMEEYHYLHLVEHFHDSVDFGNSVFRILRIIERITPRKFNSYNEIMDYEKTDFGLHVVPEKLIIVNNILNNYDYMDLYRGETSPVVSEKLKNIFEKEKITGIEFNSCPYLDHYNS